MLRFSIIVPIHNTCSVLNKCLSSLKNQTYSNYEVILIDDASTDNSDLIALEYANNNPKFRFFKNEKNKGNGYSRNIGIKESSGDWICFVDSDDFVDVTYLECIAHKIQESPYDLIMFDYNILKNKFFKKVSVPAVVSSGNSFENFLSLHYGENQFATWRYVCRKSLLIDHSVVFDESGRVFEDIIFTTRLVYFAQNVGVVRKPLYNYVLRIGSIIQTNDKRKVEDNIVALSSIRTFLIEQNDFETYKQSYSVLFLIEGFWSSSMMFAKMCTRKDKKEYLLLRGISQSKFIKELNLNLLQAKNHKDSRQLFVFKVSMRICKLSFPLYILWLKMLNFIGFS